MAIITDLDRKLETWTQAQVIDTGTAERIRKYEAEARRSSDFLVRLALLLGGIMIAGGVLLFVAAHWDQLSPSQRFSLVLLLVVVFHVAGAFAAEKMRTMAITMHALGTIALGGGIFLSGQIFNLQEHWPGGFLLWSIGAVAAWAILRHSVQGLFAAILVPIWLGGEWAVRTEHYRGGEPVLAGFIAALALSYFTAKPTMERHGFWRGLHVLGALAILPACITLAVVAHEFYWYSYREHMSGGLLILGWALALGIPTLLAVLLRGERGAILNLLGAGWIIALGLLNTFNKDEELLMYGWCAVGVVGMIAWGVREIQKNYINIGVAGFAITVITFYFSSVMGKLGRSFALILFGVVFLLGGYLLERMRRRLVARVVGGAA